MVLKVLIDLGKKLIGINWPPKKEPLYQPSTLAESTSIESSNKKYKNLSERVCILAKHAQDRSG